MKRMLTCLFLALPGLLLPTAADALDPRLAGLNDWGYILQLDGGTGIDDVAGIAFDIVVIDYSSDGSAAGEFTHQQVAALRSTGKTVLAYLSIGEAESYRYYFDPIWIDEPDPDPDAPAWLGPTNPDWAGNYKVRYWDPAWQAIVTDYLDRIVTQGFDGVYLDIVDAYYYWSEINVELTRAQAREAMISLIQSIAVHARTTRGDTDFLVAPQNAVDIIWDDDELVDARGLDYLATIDAVGVEDLFYDETTPQPPADVTYRTDALAFYLDAGGDSRRVFVIDYVWDSSDPLGAANVARVNDFQDRCSNAGFVPYAASIDRELDDLVTFGIPPFLRAQPSPGGRTVLFVDGFEGGNPSPWSTVYP